VGQFGQAGTDWLDGGRVLWIAGSAAQNQFTSGPFKHGIWNPDGTFSDTAVLDEDLFCCGMATLRAKYTKTMVGRTVYLTEELKDQLRTWLVYKYRKRMRITYDRSAIQRCDFFTVERAFIPETKPSRMCRLRCRPG